mmetsp:Transcript_18950/g.34298  ORF Transcript_18950/g.34298 Transcript_18950/m.34298 type:complete len:263 (+) Transcript_18950:4284-5072(+)
MALNPPVLPDGLPAPVNGELMVLRRDDISAEFKLLSREKYSGRGNLFMTTARLVFVNKSSGPMQSFDVPLALMSGEKFQQPIFGANYLEGNVSPLYGLIPSDAHFKFKFMSGGASTFLKLFYNLAHQIRSNHGRGPDQRFVETVSAGRLREATYMDPNDPSVIYVSQPAQAQAASNPLYYFPSAQPSYPQSQPPSDYSGVPSPPVYVPPPEHGYPESSPPPPPSNYPHLAPPAPVYYPQGPTQYVPPPPSSSAYHPVGYPPR